MRAKLGESREHFRHRVFITRTGTIFRHQAEMCRKSAMVLGFGIDDVRSRFRAATICRYCKEPLNEKTKSLDHCRPIARGGSYALANMEVICLKCNQTKGLLTDTEFSGLCLLLNSFDDEAKQDVRRRLRAGSKVLRMMFSKSRDKS